jgi:hypothetical protein
LPLNGNIKELRHRVSCHLDTPIPQPTGAPVDVIKKYLTNMWVMISNLMGMKSTCKANTNRARNLIRIFLNSVEDLDTYTRNTTDRTVPTWVSQFNHTCLLNIPDQIDELGPIRNRWEGGYRGEGFLRIVKPVVRTQQKTWTQNLLLNIVKQKTLLQLKKNNPVENIPEDTSIDNEEAPAHTIPPQSFIVYSYLQRLEILQPQNDTPISILLSNNQMYLCYKGLGDNDKFLVPLKFHDEGNATTKYNFNLPYLAIVEDSALPEVSLCEINITSFGVLLPLLVEDQGENAQNSMRPYTLVTSEWMVLKSTGSSLVKPYENFY